ncbi:MAG: hypothetical protein EOP54_00610 [Sphingobacteriales bacterium]|nr:MAG: hypothetical protein EOP54_00610 [Sphingobacteriales bacterium]
MKKLYFTLIALLFSLVALAQAPSARGLIVRNQTNCTQYYQVFGDELCLCGMKYNSQVFTIPPGGIHNYTTSVTLFGTYPPGTPKGIVGARIPNGPASCGVPAGIVGHRACGFPSTYTYMSFTPACTPCVMTKATWVDASNCEQTAQLIFQ